jgi:hypothetical protein
MTLSLLLLCVAGAASPADEVLAKVDSVAVTRADYDERSRALAAAGARFTAAEVVSTLVDEALLAAEARRLGVDREPGVVAQVERQRRRLAAVAYVEALGSSAEITDAALREMYHSTGDALRLVLVKVATEADARAALERVRKGGDLADEARRGVDGSLSSRGGDTGWIVRAAVDPKLAAAAFAATPGELIGPVPLALGWAVARLVEKRIGDDAGFSARRESLVAFARKQHAERAKAHVVAGMREKAGVRVDEAFLRSLGSRTDASPEELARVIATIDGVPLTYGDIHPAAARLLRAARGHGIGPNVRIEIAWNEVDNRLLEREAIARGFGRAPATAAALASIERYLFAHAVAARIGKSSELADPAVAERLKALRGRARIHVDQHKVAALERTR